MWRGVKSIQRIMMLIAIICGLIVSIEGLEVTIQRLPGQAICGQLQCWNIVSPDGNIFSTTSISIYDVTQPDAPIKVASMSPNAGGLYLNQSKSPDLSGSGSISRYSANLTLSFRNPADCTYGNFMCELEFVSTDGIIDHLRQNTAPTNSSGCSCSALASQVSQLQSRVSDLEGNLAGLRQNKTALEAELSSLRQLNTLLANRFDFLTQQVSNINSYINSSFTSVGTAAPPTQVTTAAPPTQAVTVAPPTQAVTVAPPTQSPVQTISACSKGAAHTNSREKFLLWGKTPALCDTQTDGGGWVIIQRRTEGDVNFYQDWSEYKNGFGTPDTDFWIGNEVIHNLTSQSYNELRVDLVVNGVSYFAHYSVFNVDNEVLNYRLTVSGYSGNAGDSLAYHSGMMFTTMDRDHDRDSGNCALHHTSAWWYNSCYRSNLNGIWGKNSEGGVIWQGISTTRSASFTEIKVRHV